MDISKKEQKQNAGDNAVQTQIENQHNYFIKNFQIQFTQGDTSKEMISTDVDSDLFNNSSEKNNTTTTTTYQKEVEMKWRLVQETNLWKKTLGKSDENVSPLRESFLDAREKTIFLLDKIKVDFPNLTMHDIIHVDSLWNVADTIIGEDYPMNPLEGYVLGIAFLIHDAALSYDAVGGKEKLRDTIEWKDAYADGVGDEDEEEFKKECDFVAIRALHANFAEKLLFQTFEKDNGTTFYIIDNYSFRNHFGNLIGKIAASHHWSIDDVETELEKLTNPLNGMPREWKINARKLACILRCADAGHIDNGRAPDSIYQSLAINGVSRQHWESQYHLCQVCEDELDSTKLCITSSHPFVYRKNENNKSVDKKEDIAAWNVAYDAVRLFDEELKKSNDLLKRISHNNSKDLTFPHKGVSGADSKETLAQYIETEGWKPCSFGVHTSNVKALIENLGGNKLYGEDNMLFVVLRELIQNARDAINARSKMDKVYKEGIITIRLKKEKDKRYVEIEDDGIGMSLDCIKYYLLDFGSSYWKSSLAKKENKGLRSSGFKSIGKYGIGFYSVFMVAKSVEVITKRYKGDINANRVEFPAGLTLSPILSGIELSPLVSTIVRFELKDDVDIKFSIKNHKKDISLQKALSLIVVGLDADVFYEDDKNKVRVHQNISSSSFDKKDWLKQLFVDSLPNHFYTIVKKLEFLKDQEGNIKGLLAIDDGNYISYDNDYVEIATPSIETVCGLSTSFNSIWGKKGFIGYIDGNENNLSRNGIVVDGKPKGLLQKWIIEKYNEDYNKIIDSITLSECYYSAFSYCGMNLNEIIDENTKTFYVTYKQRGIEIGTIKGLKRIHVLLFSGVSTFAGNYRIQDIIYYRDVKTEIKNTIHSNALDNVLSYIEKMKEDSYADIICKFIKMMIAHPFVDGNERAGRIWVNLMLDHFNSVMINWRNVDNKTLYEMAFSKLPAIEQESGVFKNESFEDTCAYLEQFLTPTNTFIAEITSQ